MAELVDRHRRHYMNPRCRLLSRVVRSCLPRLPSVAFLGEGSSVLAEDLLLVAVHPRDHSIRLRFLDHCPQQAVEVVPRSR